MLKKLWVFVYFVDPYIKKLFFYEMICRLLYILFIEG